MSTAAVHTGLSAEEYLKEYVLIDIPAGRIETFRRATDGDWLFHEFGGESGDCRFASLGLSIPLDEIFENVAAEPSPGEPSDRRP